MKPLLFELDAAPGLEQSLCERLGFEVGQLFRRHFPDGETYLRFETPVADRDIVLLCTLDRPDPKALPLLFSAAAARDHGAKGIGLVAPYLAYMRQDQEFHEGEAVTSKAFARLLSAHVDWLVTVDPHLHRYPTLDAVYSVPAMATTAAEPIADWIGREVERPFIVGPDEESSQWVERIAGLAGVPSTVLRKLRGGDYSVRIDGNGLAEFSGMTPVIVDDIASSARTLIETTRQLRAAGHRAPVCAIVHAIFAGDAYDLLLEAGAAKVVSTNSVAHATNAIDVAGPLAIAVKNMLKRAAGN